MENSAYTARSRSLATGSSRWTTADNLAALGFGVEAGAAATLVADSKSDIRSPVTGEEYFIWATGGFVLGAVIGIGLVELKHRYEDRVGGSLDTWRVRTNESTKDAKPRPRLTVGEFGASNLVGAGAGLATFTSSEFFDMPSTFTKTTPRLKIEEAKLGLLERAKEDMKDKQMTSDDKALVETFFKDEIEAQQAEVAQARADIPVPSPEAELLKLPTMAAVVGYLIASKIFRYRRRHLSAAA